MVSGRIVVLCRVQALLAIEAAADVDLVCQRNNDGVMSRMGRVA